MVARPKGSKPITPTTRPAKTTSRYQRLLIKYLANIERIERERSERQVKEYREAVATENRKAEELAKDPAVVLAKLRAEYKKRPSKKIDFRQDRYESINRFIFGMSPQSASIVKKLYREAAFASVLDILWLLGNQKSTYLHEEWISFVQNILVGSEKSSDVWRRCISLLYSRGGGRKEYGLVVRNLAVEQQDAGALSSMFFTINVHTGSLEPIVTTENLALAKELAQAKHSPAIRVTCAHYALKIRDYDLAQDVCERLLTQTYRWMDKPDAPPLEEDRRLSYARRAAMTLMFYGIKNERMFRLLYDRATIIDREPIVSIGDIVAKQKADPANAQAYEPKWVSFNASAIGQREVDGAKRLIRQVCRWNAETINVKGTRNED